MDASTAEESRSPIHPTPLAFPKLPQADLSRFTGGDTSGSDAVIQAVNTFWTEHGLPILVNLVECTNWAGSEALNVTNEANVATGFGSLDSTGLRAYQIRRNEVVRVLHEVQAQVEQARALFNMLKGCLTFLQNHSSKSPHLNTTKSHVIEAAGRLVTLGDRLGSSVTRAQKMIICLDANRGKELSAYQSWQYGSTTLAFASVTPDLEDEFVLVDGTTPGDNGQKGPARDKPLSASRSNSTEDLEAELRAATQPSPEPGSLTPSSPQPLQQQQPGHPEHASSSSDPHDPASADQHQQEVTTSPSEHPPQQPPQQQQQQEASTASPDSGVPVATDKPKGPVMVHKETQTYPSHPTTELPRTSSSTRPQDAPRGYGQGPLWVPPQPTTGLNVASLMHGFQGFASQFLPGVYPPGGYGQGVFYDPSMQSQGVPPHVAQQPLPFYPPAAHQQPPHQPFVAGNRGRGRGRGRGWNGQSPHH